ncbi:hypothetical protein J1N35_012017 [Gossypium stocksii]|uniref:Uncharacterized protein n=1 Tax=Gossypium stocksii TaxID=47602 RepID=A0A9D3W331_9ROSI|nr:hypothetical protein J1N35_012017 [Gossypium stocksii]
MSGQSRGIHEGYEEDTRRSRGTHARLDLKVEQLNEVVLESPNSNLKEIGDDELKEEAMRLGLIVMVFKAKKAKESEKKPVKYFLCCGPYRLRNYPELEAICDQKLNKKIKKVKSEKVSAMGVAQGAELQIGEWKGKKNFEVIHLNDYDFVLGLNFLDRIKACLFPFVDCIHIFDDLISQIVLSVNRDMRIVTKVLLAIQLVEDVSYGRDIDLVDWSAKEVPLEMLVEQKINLKPVELLVELPPMRVVGCASAFRDKMVMQTG